MVETIHLYGIPSSESAEKVKEYLERYTGVGTVFAIKLRNPKNGRAFACVQFTAPCYVDDIIELASKRLKYDRFYLKAKKAKSDIDPKPRRVLEKVEDVTLHFGCQVSDEKFCTLWKKDNVRVEFEFGIRKIHFYVLHNGIDYKLDISYEDIWQVELNCPRAQLSRFLLIQLVAAPRIYENIYDDPLHNFYSDTPDDQWVRTVDITKDCCIGQSSAICLELSQHLHLPKFEEYFAYYKRSERPFVLENCLSFCRNFDLVPIISPPRGVMLPFKILFRICSLVQYGCLSGPTLDALFFRMVDPYKLPMEMIDYVLEKLYNLKECCYDPVKWLKEQYEIYLASKQRPKSPAISLDGGLVYVHRVQVTPCKIYCCGPEINVSNRILRKYPDDIDNFLRISFVEENSDKMFSTDLSPRTSSTNGDRRTELYKRILYTLKNGVFIGDRKFEFLAFSSSQLRDNSAWMFASTPDLSAADIRRNMGDFSEIRNVAKYAARLGQSFSSSKETLKVREDERKLIRDVKVRTGNITYTFSDGIGKISRDFAQQVANKCGLKDYPPSAFQIRYGGFKGVVAIDPTSSVKLSLRKSMSKYKSEDIGLDVLGWSKYQPCFLNRQIITLLSTLGVRDHVFEKKQREAVRQLDDILTDPLRAQDALDLMSLGENTNILKEMLMCGYKPDAEPFLSMMLQTFRASKLLELKMKTRIFIVNGRSMMGCLDETRTLEYGQVFAQYSGSARQSQFEDLLMGYSFDSERRKHVISGKVVVAKNPCLHPGDVRVLTAVDVPALRHMVDCVVFPQKGMRPHPNECSGSDLDGDIYFVCWDPELIPPQQYPPMDYTPAPSTCLDHDVTMEEVQEYFTNYIVNDSLGIIANAHTAFADKSPDKALSTECIQLAKLFSIAVDFPKTGVPAVIPRELQVKEFPDFMEKPDKTTYESQNVIGKLFREVKDIAPTTSPIKSFTHEVARRSYDTDMEYFGYKEYLNDASYHKGQYDYKLGNLMEYYGIKTEAELLSGGILKMSKSFDRRRDLEAIMMAVRSLRKEARGWFNENGSDMSFEEDDVYAKASAWYHVTYHPDYWGMSNEGMKRDHYLSFPWCVYDKLIYIKREAVNLRRALGRVCLN